MLRKITDEERRGRLGKRHALATECKVGTPEDVASALVAVHGTDPSSTVLGILARTRGCSIAKVESALYDQKVLVRVLGMRRTVFAVDYTLAPSIWVASDYTVARNQRRLLEQLVDASGIAGDSTNWVRTAENRLLEIIEENPECTSSAIAAADEMLGHRVRIGGASAYVTEVTVASRLLTLLSAEGRVIRARPLGGWTSSQFTWVATSQWRSDWPRRPEISEDADTAIANLWLERYGPALVDDFSWWTGWSKGRAKKAFANVGACPVEIDAGEGWVLPSDTEPEVDPAPWVALLPGLDSTTMGWKQREFYLGPYAERVFDNVGNAGPTVWTNGRIVGGWSQLDRGDVVFELFEDVGSEVAAEVAHAASALQETIADVRLKPRARRWTRSEKSLRA